MSERRAVSPSRPTIRQFVYRSLCSDPLRTHPRRRSTDDLDDAPAPVPAPRPLQVRLLLEATK